jgi:hypothetical protein
MAVIGPASATHTLNWNKIEEISMASAHAFVKHSMFFKNLEESRNRPTLC